MNQSTSTQMSDFKIKGTITILGLFRFVQKEIILQSSNKGSIPLRIIKVVSFVFCQNVLQLKTKLIWNHILKKFCSRLHSFIIRTKLEETVMYTIKQILYLQPFYFIQLYFRPRGSQSAETNSNSSSRNTPATHTSMSSRENEVREDSF